MKLQECCLELDAFLPSWHLIRGGLHGRHLLNIGKCDSVGMLTRYEWSVGLARVGSCKKRSREQQESSDKASTLKWAHEASRGRDNGDCGAVVLTWGLRQGTTIGVGGVSSCCTLKTNLGYGGQWCQFLRY